MMHWIATIKTTAATKSTRFVNEQFIWKKCARIRPDISERFEEVKPKIQKGQVEMFPINILWIRSEMAITK